MARPSFEPTAEQRGTVEAMVAYGIPEEEIARTLGPRGIDPKTLRKHFRKELDVGATKANAAVGQTLYQMATSGKHPACTMFWLKCRAGWKETQLVQHSGPQDGPIEITHAELDQQITAELARVAASRSVVPFPGRVDAPTEEASAVPVAGLESAA